VSFDDDDVSLLGVRALIFGLVFFCTDNGLVAESRFILMDSQLLAFTALSFVSKSKFDEANKRSECSR
jgi:dolichyl-phosphate-mannose--protein O-mannosyl transferase